MESPLKLSRSFWARRARALWAFAVLIASGLACIVAFITVPLLAGIPGRDVVFAVAAGTVT